MAASQFDIVVLSSSPPEHAWERETEGTGAPTAVAHPPLSPSPTASSRRVGMPPPSPLQLSPRVNRQIKTSGALKSGSRVATIPEGARRGFAAVRSLVADVDDDDLPEFDWGQETHQKDQDQDQVHSEKAPTKAQKLSKKASAADIDAGVPKPAPKPRGRKPKTTKDDEPAKPTKSRKKTLAPTTSSHFATTTTAKLVDTDDDPQPKPKPTTAKPRRPRTKKASGDAGAPTAIKKTHVARSKGTKSTRDVSGKTTDVMSARFDSVAERGEANTTREASNAGESVWDIPMSPSSKSIARVHQPGLDEEPLDLDEAINRRRDWTPIKDSVTAPVDSAAANESTVDGKGGSSFTNMISGFAYAQAQSTSHATTSKPSAPDGNAATKRRRAEPVDVPANHLGSRQSSPEKGKAPKKKPRTITDLVTEQYAPKSAESEESVVTSDFFSFGRTTATTTKVPLNDTLDQPPAKASKKLSRKRSTSKSASEKEDDKRRANPKKPSTKSANPQPKLVEKKLLSPASALLRLEKQDVLFGTSSQLALDESPTTLRQIQQALLVSEVDPDGDLRSVPIYSNHPSWLRLERAQGKRRLWAAGSRDEAGKTLDKQEVYMHLPEPDRTQDIPLPVGGASDDDEAPSAAADDSTSSKLMSAPILISSDLPTPPSTLPKNNSGKSKHDVSRGGPTFTRFNEVLDEPFNEPPPSNQQATSVSMSFIDFPPSAQLPPDSPTPPCHLESKRKRGRPPNNPHSSIPQATTSSLPTVPPTTPEKKTQDRFAFIEEILDSEDDTALSPTPPRVNRLEGLPPLEFATTTESPTKSDFAPIFRIPESHLHFETIKPILFPKITALIRALPPTTDPRKPSWHEKILMYDAIVLEDFTAFLNSHASVRTYKRATQKQARAWNKERKAKGEPIMKAEKGDGMVLAVEKEVEGWMVRGWCEEHSVCCVQREGKGRGKGGGV